MLVEGLVSTIIPVYNRSGMLQEAVTSVLAQSYRPIEIIIVNDGSTDDTASVADALEKRYPDIVKVLHGINAGPGMARETGRVVARGEFIQYLDSDDLLMANKFEFQVASLKKNPECGISYGVTRFRFADGGVLGRPWKRTGECITKLFPSMLVERWWGTSTPLYRCSLLNAVGPWLDLKNEEDWEYDCRIAAHGVTLDYVSEVISEERDHCGERLSNGGTTNPQKLSSRARAHELIYSHARNAGIDASTSEMQHFSRALFLLVRQCGAAGLSFDSRHLFSLAREAAGIEREDALDFRAYERLANLFGWRAIGRLSCFLDILRR